jgi:hypothetical protein
MGANVLHDAVNGLLHCVRLQRMLHCPCDRIWVSARKALWEQGA